MTLAIFDLDNTLLGGDSDHAWNDFLVERGIVDRDHFRRENDRFHRAYDAGTLDIHEYLAFALEPLTRHSMAELDELHRRFMKERIDPIILPHGEALLEKHRAHGDLILIITATNRFVTGPIAQRLGVEHLLAVEPEMEDDRYTGRVTGTPSFREGKIVRLEQWLKTHDVSLEGAFFYSDSQNDLPLLERVDHPVAVDPDPVLADVARQRNWQIITLRDRDERLDSL
ncbi:HAD family hydrolase [Kushneria marisflavi]|uniref:Histidinol-phosphatase n=1 Tax=Kushneria marisflavi TaxID=157779 RepID=A0A240UUS1_9GAMM|nr:HAD family hydrolase [Kushneria marisflavi]ART64789.1 phosphoserine phosphatase [Kushneria marisflavi]RKD85707.1 HAD superfamily hydrolase (TIGR01490 family) [Kushneria marisflavi]